MGVVIGQTLGRYRIVEQIGAGGMGVVYRAHDERLGRDLAIKVLSPGALGSSGARRRFRNEALILSKLNHPAIQIIHDFDSVDDLDFLVSEFVPGVPLDVMLASGPLAEEKIVRLGIQLAQGLAAAHTAGVLHRDLKPSNLKVTPDGRLKILDFGLATLSPQALENLSATVSLVDAPGSQAGTLPYMSPEQLLGKEIDERADIYSAGVALFELATGQLPFTDLSVGARIESILHKTAPSAAGINRKISAEMDRIIGKCLEKDPELRYQSAKDLGADLRRMEVSSSSRAVAAAEEKQEKKKPKLAWVAAGIGVAALLGIAAVLFLKQRGQNGEAPLGALTFEQLTNFTDSATSPSLSADGKMLTFIRGENTFVGPGEIYVKFLPKGEPVQLTKDGLGKMSPVFSPSGDRIAYTVDLRGMSTWVVPTLGGEARALLQNASGLTWMPGEETPRRVLFSELTGAGIHMALATADENRTNERMVYVPADSKGMAHRSYPSPDGKWVLVVQMNMSGWMPCALVSFAGKDGPRTVGPAPAQCTGAAWSPDGKWMYFSANAGSGFHIWRQRFPDGAREQITFGASEEQGIWSAPDGHSLVTAIGTNQSALWVHMGSEDRQITSEGFAFRPSFSRDGKKIYYLVRSGASTHFVSGQLRAVNLETRQYEDLLPNSHMEDFDISYDGTKVVYVNADASGRSPIWIAPLDGSGAPQVLTRMDAVRARFGRSGDIYFVGGEQGESYFWRMKQDGTGLQKIVSTPVMYLYSISPDEKWAGIWEGSDVVVQPLDGSAPTMVLPGGGTAGEENRGVTPPLVSWSPDMKHVYLHEPSWERHTYAIPLLDGRALPSLPKGGLGTEKEVAALVGAKLLPQARASGGAQPGEYIYVKVTTQRNIYRIGWR